MRTNEQITPAQAALLNFLDHLNAGDIYDSIHTTFTLSLTGRETDECATPIACEAWYFTAELLKYIKDIATENRKNLAQ
jgi:hypothetical protein